uniref:Uncharacterized protein n=1 Tax=Rhizophora mucronata TaxID=61149 RepID=A0A2P2KVI3_RHIMU
MYIRNPKREWIQTDHSIRRPTMTNWSSEKSIKNLMADWLHFRFSNSITHIELSTLNRSQKFSFHHFSNADMHVASFPEILR